MAAQRRGIAVRPRALEDPPAEVGAAAGRDALERGRHVERVVESEHGLLRLLDPGLGGRQVRIDEIAELRLHRLVEASGDAPPRDEERLPSAGLAREREPLVDQRSERGHAGGVERVAEAGPDAPAGEQPEHPLVIDGAPAAPRKGTSASNSARLASLVHWARSPSTRSSSRRRSLASRPVASGARLAERPLEEIERRIEPARRLRRGRRRTARQGPGTKLERQPEAAGAARRTDRAPFGDGVGVHLEAREIDRSHRRELSLDHDAHFAALAALGLLERRRDGREPDEALVVDVDHVAGDAPRSRRSRTGRSAPDARARARTCVRGRCAEFLPPHLAARRRRPGVAPLRRRCPRSIRAPSPRRSARRDRGGPARKRRLPAPPPGPGPRQGSRRTSAAAQRLEGGHDAVGDASPSGRPRR